MKPLTDYILVGELTKENKTDGGIILTTKIDKTSNPGVALAIGDEVKHVKKGDTVALDWSKGLPVTIQGQQAILISEEFIRGIY